jgi:hypothetical protein
MTSFYRECETELEQTMTLRRHWDHATQHTRQLAIAADTELRRRHPHQHIEPLRTAEPVLTDTQRDQLHPHPGAQQYQTPDWITALASERRAVRQQLAQRPLPGAPTHQPGHQPTAWPAAPGYRPGAILQPPAPQIPASHPTAERPAQTQPEPQ